MAITPETEERRRGSEEFHDLFAETNDTLSIDWQNGSVAVARGVRSGTGVRSRDTGGEILFRSLDETDSERIPWDIESLADWEGELALALAYLALASEGAARELGGGSSGALDAKVSLYRQEIRYETKERIATDVRSGARLELRLSGAGGGPVSAQIAARTMQELRSREPAFEVGRGLGLRALQRRGALAPFDAVLPVVFAPGGCGALLHEIGHLLEEDVGGAADGHALFKLGERVGPAALTIIDDPLVCPGRGSYLVDDEGSAPSACVLIDAGIVSARLEGAGRMESARAGGTGHSRRASYRDLPAPRMASTFMKPGADDPEEIVRGTPHGVYVRALRSGRVDPSSGDMTLSMADASLIERGRIGRALDEGFIIASARAVLESLDAVGSDLVFDHGAGNCIKHEQQLPVTVGLPTVRIGVARVHVP